MIVTCPTLCDPLDCNLPGFSALGTFQARILEWVAMPFSRGSSGPRDQWASPVAQMVENMPAMQETWVWSLSQKDPLEKGIAIHSSILAWRIPWTEEPGGLQSMGLQTIWHNWAINTFHFHVLSKGEQATLSIIIVLVHSLECACLVRRWGKSPGMGEGQLFC